MAAELLEKRVELGRNKQAAEIARTELAKLISRLEDMKRALVIVPKPKQDSILILAATFIVKELGSVHGDCTCPITRSDKLLDLNSKDCQLHSWMSSHSWQDSRAERR